MKWAALRDGITYVAIDAPYVITETRVLYQKIATTFCLQFLGDDENPGRQLGQCENLRGAKHDAIIDARERAARAALRDA